MHLVFCRATQANIPNVTVVQQQTQMAESMVSRNAALAEESIRQELMLFDADLMPRSCLSVGMG